MFNPANKKAFFEKLKQSGKLNPSLDHVKLPRTDIAPPPQPANSPDKLDINNPMKSIAPPVTPIASGLQPQHFKRLKRLFGV